MNAGKLHEFMTGRMDLSRRRFISGCSVQLAWPGVMRGGSWGAGTSLVRRATGEYQIVDRNSGAIAGHEVWSISAHANGHRTVMATRDDLDLNRRLVVVLHADARLRPLAAHVTRVQRGAYACATYRVSALSVCAEIDTGNQSFTRTFDVPDKVSLMPHPLATDGWHTWYIDKHIKGLQSGKTVDIDVATLGTASLAAKVRDIAWEFIADEQITLPIGTFTAAHYRGREVDLWVHGPDAVLIGLEFNTGKVRCLLTAYRQQTAFAR